MIIGNLVDIDKYLDDAKHNLIMQFIDKVKTEDVKIGEWIFLNDEIKALVLIKSGYKEGVFESHRIYKDLHITVAGMDTIFLGNKTSSTIKSDYEGNGDYTLYNAQTIASVNSYENTFALIDQEEIHSNLIEGNNTKKIVIKLKKQLC